MQIISMDWGFLLWSILNVAILILVIYLINRYFKKSRISQN